MRHIYHDMYVKLSYVIRSYVTLEALHIQYVAIAYDMYDTRIRNKLRREPRASASAR